MYWIEIVIRFNQSNRLPDSIKQVHRVANTDFYEIYAGTISEQDFNETHRWLERKINEREIVTYFFEFQHS